MAPFTKTRSGFQESRRCLRAAGSEASSGAACGFQVVFREVDEEKETRNVIVVVKGCE